MSRGGQHGRSDLVRFVFAIVCFVLAAGMIGVGIAQRTFLASPDSVVLSASASGTAPLTVIDGASLNAFDGNQTFRIKGVDATYAAYGRTDDVLGWVGDATYNALAYDAETGELVSTLVRGTESSVPNPDGSDLWFEGFASEDGDLRFTVDVPEGVSFVIASDGTLPAPKNLELTWPLDNRTPFSAPLIIGGGVVLLVGLVLLLWAINRERRPGGPRRKPQKMPKLPRQPRYKPSRKAVTAGEAATGRRAARPMVAVTLLLAASLALSGCSPDPGASAPNAAPSPGVSGEPEITDSSLPAPAVTVRQVERIVARISAVSIEADAALNTELMATRFAGPALELRAADYKIRTVDAAIVSSAPAIPAGPVRVTLPQQTGPDWPRTVFAVIQDEADTTIPPVALFLIQEDARSNYKVHYAVTLEPSAVLPDVAPASVGTARLSADTGVFRIAPSAIALAYADILAKDIESDSYLVFEAAGDSLRVAVGLAAQQARAADLPATAQIAFGQTPGPGQIIVMATNDSGALVAVNLNETVTVKPIEAGAAVNTSGAVKALSGVAASNRGVTATYGDQLLFYVPAADSSDKIVLLGYSQGLVAALEVP